MAEFDPDAYLAAKPTTPAAFDPDAYLAGTNKSQGLLGNIYEAGRSALSTINETLNPLSEAVRARHAAESKQPFFSMPSDVGAVGRGLAAIPEFAASPVTGTVKTSAPYLADLEARAIQAVGEPIARSLNPNPALPTRETIARDIEPQVETALGLLGAKRPVPGPVPPRPMPSGPFGVNLSEGQATGDLSAIQREQAALRGTAGAPAQRTAQAFADQQAAELAAAHTDLAGALDTIGGQVIAAGPQEAGEIVSAGVQQAARTAKAGVKSAYDVARAMPGEIHAGVFENMSSGIKGDLSLRPEPVIIDDRLTPYASRMIGDIEDRVSQLRIQNRADPFGQPNPENIVGVNLAGVDQMRKRLSSMRRDAYASGNAADGRAAQAVLDAFDQRIDRAVNGGMFTGDARAVQAWNDARAAYADYRSTFTGNKNDPIGGVVEKIIGDRTTVEKTGNDVADHLFGTSGVNPSSLNVGVANRIKGVLGEQSPEWIGAKQGLFSRLTETPQGVKDWGPGKVADRLNRFLNGDGKELAGVVFSPQEHAMLQRYADLMRQLEVPQVGANWSNTATFMQKIGSRLGTMVGAVIGGGIGHAMGFPFIGEVAGAGMAQGARKIGEAAAARKISGQMPLVTTQLRAWQQAVARAQGNPTPSTRLAVTAASANLARSLEKLGINLPAVAIANPEQNQEQIPRPPPQQHHGGAVENKQTLAQGGHVVPLRQHGGRVNAENIEKEPSEKQKHAGNYAKDHLSVHGLDITIENAKGHERRGVDKGGKPWSVTMPAHYGYIKQTEGKDRDHIDVYLGPHTKAPKAFVIDQKNAETGRFDEHKTFLNFASEQQVRACYAKAFSDGKAHLRLGHIEEMTVEQFKHWLSHGDTTKPIKNGEDKKLPHSAVGYVATSPHVGKYCGVCSMFVKEGPHCTLVQDPVRAIGYCRRFFKGEPHAS